VSDNGNSVTCEAHGDGQAAFVCQHLLSGSGLGFNWAEDSENPDAHCPDARCDTCNTALEAAGAWTESAMALANIKLVCDLCYEQLRERNWLEDSKEFSRLISKAVSFLEKRQTRLWKKFRIGEYERFDWDQETGQLVFHTAASRESSWTSCSSEAYRPAPTRGCGLGRTSRISRT
jgi:hypothetical protein